MTHGRLFAAVTFLALYWSQAGNAAFVGFPRMLNAAIERSDLSAQEILSCPLRADEAVLDLLPPT